MRALRSLGVEAAIVPIWWVGGKNCFTRRREFTLHLRAGEKTVSLAVAARDPVGAVAPDTAPAPVDQPTGKGSDLGQ